MPSPSCRRTQSRKVAMASASMLGGGGPALQLQGERTSGEDIRTQNVTAVAAIANISQEFTRACWTRQGKLCKAWLGDHAQCGLVDLGLWGDADAWLCCRCLLTILGTSQSPMTARRSCGSWKLNTLQQRWAGQDSIAQCPATILLLCKGQRCTCALHTAHSTMAASI